MSDLNNGQPRYYRIVEGKFSAWSQIRRVIASFVINSGNIFSIWED